MVKDVVVAKKGESIKHLFKLMDEGAILGVPVVDSDQSVIGVVTESDLIKHFTTLKTPRGIYLLGSIVFLNDVSSFNQNLKEHTAETVEEIMTTEPILINEDDTLQTAIDIMSQKCINRLPVVGKNNRLVGIITRSDVLHELAKLTTI